MEPGSSLVRPSTLISHLSSPQKQECSAQGRETVTGLWICPEQPRIRSVLETRQQSDALEPGSIHRDLQTGGLCTPCGRLRAESGCEASAYSLTVDRFPGRKNPPWPLKARLDMLQNTIKGCQEPLCSLRSGMLGCTQRLLPVVSASFLETNSEKALSQNTGNSVQWCPYKQKNLPGLLITPQS